jgi:hypothetical protein
MLWRRETSRPSSTAFPRSPGTAGLRHVSAFDSVCVRVEVAEAPEDLLSALISGRVRVPLESFPISRVVRGTFVGGEDGNHAAPGQPHPWIAWESTIVRVTQNADGTCAVTPNEKLNPQLRPGVTLGEAPPLDVWGPALDPTLGIPQAPESSD